jgi:homoserine dehydrogenase
VTPLDFQYANRLHCTIRQVARAACDGTFSAAVGPALVPLTSPLARVQGSENLVTVKGRFGGETSFGGRGAGGDPTAVAVVSDVLAIARGARPPSTAPSRRVDHVSAAFATPYYVRFTVADRPGIIAALASVFAAHGINIDAILQEPGFPADRRPFVVSPRRRAVAGARDGAGGDRRAGLSRRPAVRDARPDVSGPRLASSGIGGSR